MRAKQFVSRLVMSGLLATAMAAPALAQSMPATSPPAATTMPAPRANGENWRASKLMGLDVYNDQNEKLGDINEILLDRSGNVTGVVIGVGGFLGMGEHDIMVELNKLKFVDQAVRTSAATTTATTGAASSTTTSRPSTMSSETKWYPDHAVLSGVTKEQLKNMPQFKYN